MGYFLFALACIFGIIWFCAFIYQGKRDDAKHMAELKGQAQQKQRAVVERRTETERVIQTEKVIIELVPNEDLSQSLSNLIGSINNSTDATNHHAQVIETTAQIVPFLQESQERAIKPVDLGQDGSKASGKSRQEVIAELLLEEPTIGGKEIERRTGIPDATARRILKELKST